MGPSSVLLSFISDTDDKAVDLELSVPKDGIRVNENVLLLAKAELALATISNNSVLPCCLNITTSVVIKDQSVSVIASTLPIVSLQPPATTVLVSSIAPVVVETSITESTNVPPLSIVPEDTIRSSTSGVEVSKNSTAAFEKILDLEESIANPPPAKPGTYIIS